MWPLEPIQARKMSHSGAAQSLTIVVGGLPSVGAMRTGLKGLRSTPVETWAK